MRSSWIIGLALKWFCASSLVLRAHSFARFYRFARLCARAFSRFLLRSFSALLADKLSLSRHGCVSFCARASQDRRGHLHKQANQTDKLPGQQTGLRAASVCARVALLRTRGLPLCARVQTHARDRAFAGLVCAARSSGCALIGHARTRVASFTARFARFASFGLPSRSAYQTLARARSFCVCARVSFATRLSDAHTRLRLCLTRLHLFWFICVVDFALVCYLYVCTFVPAYGQF